MSTDTRRWPDTTVIPYEGIHPRIPDSVYLAPGARITGDVEMGEECSVWFNTVIRGDVNRIRIGARTNVQDASVLHVTLERFSLTIGSEVTIGHNAILHGCVVEDLCLIGMGAIVMDGAVIGRGSMVAAGCLVSPGTQVPPGSLIVGSPGKVRRELSDEERAFLPQSAQHYVDHSRIYMGARKA